jgi:hypothetical protein
MLNEELIAEIAEAIGWVENEYGFVTDVLKKCRTHLREEDWQSMDSAPTDGTIVEIYVEGYETLLPFVILAHYDPYAGWCVDELRQAIAWRKRIKPSWAK